MRLIIGTRGSALALWQARHVASLIERAQPEIQVELKKIKTKGDKILDTPLANIGGKGLFTKEIEEALLDGAVDLAVHSMKDLPTDLPDGLKLAAVLEREDPRDVFVSRDSTGLAKLGPGARIGTSSLRRKAFLLYALPELEVIPIRGNVDTRLKKIQSEDLAGVILACAGVKRMGFAGRITGYMDTSLILPAIGQGALGIETRQDDPRVESIVRPLNHEDTETCVLAERAFLRRMGGGCQVPMAAYAEIRDNRLCITAAVVNPDGSTMIRETLTDNGRDSSVGIQVADILIQRGASEIAKAVLGQDWKPGPAG